MSVEFEDLKRLEKQLGTMIKAENIDNLCRSCIKELAQIFIRNVIERTPVKTGNLRRNWTVGDIIKTGSNYSIEIYNPTFYAKYVEYGHRLKIKRGNGISFRWVDGRFMMTVTETILKDMIDGRIMKKVDNYIRSCLSDFK